MAVTMLTAFNSIIVEISTDYAKRYTVSSANVLSAHITREINTISKAARSDAVTRWLKDEDDEAKKLLAYKVLAGVVGELYSDNLYIGIEKSRNEYKIEEDYTEVSVNPLAALNEDDPVDDWYFKCIGSVNAYIISVGIDHVLERKRLWLDYKVESEGETLGVVCTGLEFSHVSGEIFSQVHNTDMRGFITDVNGVIYMDSLLLADEDFLNYTYEMKIDAIFSDKALLDAINSNMICAEGYFDPSVEPQVVKLGPGSYGYATIAPIAHTDWIALILYDPSATLNMSLFLPAFAIMVLLLIAFSAVTNAFSNRLIFRPLEQLDSSLPRLTENGNVPIYGLDRVDEFGNLANTIQELFSKANHDALTEIFNRRFMENNLQHFMEFLSRSNGLLSVLMIDVDYFKLYNDNYGHDQGDICLKKITHAITGSIPRTTDFAARYGGEEFVVVLPNTDKAGAVLIAEKVLNNVRELAIPHAKSAASDNITVSIGVTTGRVTYSQKWEEYVKRADEAMYASKQGGRDRYTFKELGEKL